MKRMFSIVLAIFLSSFIGPAWAQTCGNASLNGKYVLSGQGDMYNVCILGGICLAHSTVSSTGYIVADGNGNITSARLFQATNSGVQDTGIVNKSAGTYSVSDCNNGTLSLTLNGQVFMFTLEVNDVDANGLAHSGEVLDADSGHDESLQMVRTVDPAGTNACGSGFSLNGIVTNGIERGHDNVGNPVSGVVSEVFNNGALSGTEKKSSPSGSTTAAISGTYTINPDCSVLMTRTINGTTKTGAHMVSGGDPAALIRQHAFVWQGDWIEYEEEDEEDVPTTW
ncbi:hypothetical protein [Paraburkholderia caffeinilytica]|uniref:hypothetical protein n=1 Tax=Paraburkholderia caffeinilytica TaxID=1761016 RepID=UPI003D9FBB88